MKRWIRASKSTKWIGQDVIPLGQLSRPTKSISTIDVNQLSEDDIRRLNMKRYVHATSSKYERALTFRYTSDDAAEKAVEVENVLQDNGIEYVVYDDYGEFKFVVRRSGKSWNDIMKLINSVKPAKYSYTQTNFTDENGRLEEVVYLN